MVFASVRQKSLTVQNSKQMNGKKKGWLVAGRKKIFSHPKERESEAFLVYNGRTKFFKLLFGKIK